MIASISPLNVWLAPRRSSAIVVDSAACSCTCQARDAQALRCYEPPYGGKTSRGRAFVVRIGHPRRELSPGRRSRACRGATYKVVARVSEETREGGFLPHSPFLLSAKRVLCAEEYTTRDVPTRLRNVQLTLELGTLILRSSSLARFATRREDGNKFRAEFLRINSRARAIMALPPPRTVACGWIGIAASRRVSALIWCIYPRSRPYG